MTQDPSTLGQRIQESRKAAGLSQEALGQELNVSRQAVSKWEADAAIPELENLIAMSRLFGVSVGRLLGVEAEQQPEAAPPADDELTEAQLRMVQEIVDRYLAAQPEKKKSPWGKRDVRVLFALCGIMLALLVGLGRRVAQLDSRYTGLQQSISGVSSSVNGQINSMARQISTILDEKNNILYDSTATITDFDGVAETVTLRLTAAPKEWTASTAAVFTAALSDGRTFTAEGTGRDGIFTAEGFVVPMDQEIALSVALTDGDASRAGAMETLYDCLPGCFSLEVDCNWGGGWSAAAPATVRKETLDLHISPPANAAFSLRPTAVSLCVFRNRETQPEQSFPVPEAVSLYEESGYVQQFNNFAYQTSFELAEGDTVMTALRIDDDHGQTTYTLLDAYRLKEKKSLSSSPIESARLHLQPWQPGEIPSF